MENKSSLATYIAAIVSIILWGYSFVWTNSLLQYEVPVFTLLFIRLAIAGVLLFVASKFLGKLQKVDKKDIKWLFLMALSEPFVYFIGETYGMLATGSATIAAVIIATIPIFCLILERILWNKRFTTYKIVGILLTIPGILMVVFQDGPVSVSHAYGIALLFMAVAAATSYAVVVKKLSGKYNSFTITTYQFVIGALLFFPLFLLYGRQGLNEKFFTVEVLTPLLTLAVLCSCVAFLLWVSVIGKLGITRANIFSALIPAVSAVGAFMLGQESLPLIRIIGIAVVIIGVILAQKES
jgi:drug/metabolite transporter (DMT)-like permease